MNRSPRLIAVVAFAATFAAGAASMYAVGVWSDKPKPVAATSWAEVANALQLTPAQKQQVDEVFARYQPSTDAVLTSLGPRLAAVTDSMHRDIEALLTPEQRERLKKLQRPATYVLRRKSPMGSRVDTVRIPPNR